MQISPALAPLQADEDIQTLVLKKALKVDETEQMALLESAKLTGPSQPLDTRLVGRLLNEKA